VVESSIPACEKPRISATARSVDQPSRRPVAGGRRHPLLRAGAGPPFRSGRFAYFRQTFAREIPSFVCAPEGSVRDIGSPLLAKDEVAGFSRFGGLSPDEAGGVAIRVFPVDEWRRFLMKMISEHDEAVRVHPLLRDLQAAVDARAAAGARSRPASSATSCAARTRSGCSHAQEAVRIQARVAFASSGERLALEEGVRPPGDARHQLQPPRAPRSERDARHRGFAPGDAQRTRGPPTAASEGAAQ
jgi:hypothetical protein